MAWQRLIVDIPEEDDLTELDEEEQVIWFTKKIVVCPNCGRNGANFDNGVVHVTDSNRKPLDFCLSDVPEDSPAVVVIDYDGRPLRSISLADSKKEVN